MQDGIKTFQRKNIRSQFESQFGGKTPPQAVDLEEAVLGALMLDKSAISEVLDVLKPESFYIDAHKLIYKSIKTLFDESQPIDILTVTQELRKTGELEMVGGPGYISQLTNRVASSANVEFHARVITEKHILREVIKISSKLIEKAYDETSDVFEVLDMAEKDLFEISEGNIKKNYDSMSDLLAQAIKQIEAAAEQKDGLSGVPTGFTDLDRLTGGWQLSDLIILAGRPGMGKTAFVLSMAKNIAVQFDIPIAVFSLEMSAVQLVNRMISAETGISGEKLKKGNLEPYEYQQLHSRIDRLSKAPIFIDDTAALSVSELRAKARRLVSQHGVKIIIIDYLQLMTGSGDGSGNRVQEISMISRSLKIIAKELNIPVISLSQLSRSVETRGGDRRPLLSDLRESGSIEQDADIVSFIYRPEYYGIEFDENNEPTAGRGKLIIAKHRNGSLEDVNLRFIPELVKFDNLHAPDEAPNALGPDNDFDNDGGGNFQTISSRMNSTDFEDDEDDGDFNLGPSNDFDDSPF